MIGVALSVCLIGTGIASAIVQLFTPHLFFSDGQGVECSVAGCVVKDVFGEWLVELNKVL